MSERSSLKQSALQLFEQFMFKYLTGELIWKICISFLVLAALAAVISRTVVDADLWGHLRFGLDNLQSGSIAQVDPYSYLSAGQRWINHEWLAEIFFGLAWLAGGSVGLILLKTTVGVLTLGLIYWYLARSGVSPIRAGVLVILGWMGILTAIATIRPHMFTLLFSAITFIIIAQADKGKYRWLWVTPPVFILWINFHGGVLAGLGFLGIWTVVHLIFHRQEWLKILPPVILSTLAILINPYGIDLVTFLFRTATVPRPEIVEWQPLGLVSLLGGIYLLLLVITILGLVFSKQKNSVPIFILLAVAALLPFVAFRHLPLFALAALVFGGIYIDDAWSNAIPQSKASTTSPRWIIPMSVLAGLVLLVWGYSNLQAIRIPNEPEPFFPDRPVSIIQESQVTGNLAVEFNWGQYVIWHLGPQVQVSMDGRRETVYPDEIYAVNRAFIYGSENWDEVLDDYDTHMALVFHSRAAYNLLILKDGWGLIYEDAASALFADIEWSEYTRLKQAAADFIDRPDDVIFP